jgi:ABC-type lipoprotein release transport system permease subunit
MTWLRKQAHILDFTLSSLLRRRGKNLALLAVYALVVFLTASVLLFTEAVKREARLVLWDAPEIMVQRLAAGRHDLIPVSYLETLKGIRGVQGGRARWWGYYFDATNGANYTLMVQEHEKVGPGRIVVGKGVARHMPGRESGILPFKTYDGSYVFLQVADVLPAQSELISADLILVSEPDYRAIFGTPRELATDLVLRVRNPRELGTIAAKVVQLLPDTRPVLREEILRTYDAILDWRGGMIIVVLLGALLAFVIFAWDKATGLSAEERREIGVLKAVGWETSDVLLMKFWEGVAISLSSFFLGVILAYVHVFFSAAGLFEPALKGWAVIYPQFRLTPYVDPYQMVTLFFLTVIPYTVATIVPSWRAATIDPDAVMRG